MSESCEFLWWLSIALFHVCLTVQQDIYIQVPVTEKRSQHPGSVGRKCVNVRAIALVDIVTCNFSLWSSVLDVLCKIYVYAILHSSSALCKFIFTHIRRYGMLSQVIVIVHSVFFLLICSTEYDGHSNFSDV
jgi:hypothetical protein